MALEIAINKRLPGFHLDVQLLAGNQPTALLGASGSGKSMTLRAVAGLVRPDSGRIVLHDRVLFDSSTGVNVPARMRRVGLVFQNYALFPHRTVAQNVAYGLASVSQTDRTRRVEEHLDRMQLRNVAQRYPGELSGGQQQRVALARALAPDPEVLLLDEPFSALDAHLRAQVEKQLVETLAAYRGIAILVSHSLAEAYRLCPRLVVLDGGRAIAAGDTRDVFLSPGKLAVARVTGCKNFSKVRKVPSASSCEEEIDALDWNCTLRLSQPLPSQASHVGIRAHHICVFAPLETTPAPAPQRNDVLCWPAAVIEGPFDVTLYLHLNAPPSGAAAHHIQAEITKDHWQELKSHPAPWHARLAPEQLILLSD